MYHHCYILNSMTNKILLSIIILTSFYFMLTTFSSVFLEKPIDDKQRAYENIHHKMLDNTEGTIQLNTNEVRLVLEKTKQHSLEQWKS